MTETITEPAGDLLGSEPAQTTPWYGEESAELVQNKGWKSPDDALKSYSELEKMSSGRVKMPTSESSDDERRAFFQKAGCPENPDGYEIVIPEEVSQFRDEGTENALKQIAYEQGVSKPAFESIAKAYYDKIAGDMNASRVQGETELKKEFTDKYDEVVNTANRFFDSCSEDFCSMVKASGLANNPVFIKEFYNKGLQTMNDTLIQGTVEGDKEAGYVPQYKDSPEMYAAGESDDSTKARAYFTARGHKY